MATWLAAVGTIGAVVVALSARWWQAKLHGAKLDLNIWKEKGENVKNLVTPPPQDEKPPHIKPSRFYHLHVVNNRPRTPATQVQVYLQELRELDHETGEFESTWSGDAPLGWQFGHARPDQQTVGEGGVLCDLCSVLPDKWLEIYPSPKIRPVGLRTRWRSTPGPYSDNIDARPNERVEELPIVIEMTIQARGVESGSRVKKYRISWDGEWQDDDDAMREHLIVKESK